MSENPPSRNWCMTIFDRPNFRQITKAWKKELPSQVKYLIFQREICESTGNQHFQAYIELNNPMRMTGIKKLINDETVHLEIRRGTRDQAREYCMKEESKIGKTRELGDWKKCQGYRSDIADAKKSIDAGATELYMWELHFPEMVKYGKSMKRYLELKVQERNWITEVYIFWGEPGSGKSLAANSIENMYVMPYPQGKVWVSDKYSHQENVLFDDFEGSQLPIKMWDRMCDRYPMEVECKGGFTTWNPRRIYFTSNFHPKKWYPKENWAEVKRRITEIRKFEISNKDVLRCNEVGGNTDPHPNLENLKFENSKIENSPEEEKGHEPREEPVKFRYRPRSE